MKRIKTAAIIAGTVATMTLSAGLVHADTSTLLPLEINPVCADASTNLTYWNVYNKNSDNVVINWTALDNGNTGTFSAPAGHSQFASYYDASDPNNTTKFDNAIDTSAPQRNSSNTACQPGDITVVSTTPVTTGGSGGGDTTGTASTGSTGVVLGASTTAPAATTVAAAPVAATTSAPQLAYTGASQLVPYTAAAVIALFTAVTTVLVRKNVL